MAQAGNGQEDPRQNLQHLRGRHDLGLDPGGGKEEIDANRERFGSGGDETEARKPTDVDLFQVSPYGAISIPQPSNGPHHSLGFRIACHDHGNIHIVRVPGFCAHRDCQSADQGPAKFQDPGIRLEADESLFDARQSCRRAVSIARNGVPGGSSGCSSIHSCIRRAISASVASG